MSDPARTELEEAHGELSLARLALADDDLQHAADHVAGALVHAPGLPEAHELLAVVATRSKGDGLDLYPVDQRSYLGNVVAHAHLLARRDPGRALALLAEATAYEPGKPWADVSWVRALDVAALDPDTVIKVFVTVMRSFGDPADEPSRAANEVYLDLARRAVAAHDDEAMVLATAAAIGRRLGATGEAVRWGEAAVRLEPNKLTYVWYAYALRSDGRGDQGMEVLRRAYGKYPDELDLAADLAEWMADVGRLDEALALVQDAVARVPGDDCITHVLHRLRFRQDGDASHLVALVDYMRDNPVVSHDHHDLARCCDNRYWLDRPAPATEACINVLAQLPADEPHGMARLALSGLEVPSALAVVRRATPGVEIGIDGEAYPSMVLPLRPDSPVLWTYDAMTATPAVGPPAAASAAVIRNLVTPAWDHPVALYDLALPLGELPVFDLLAALVHPPEPRADLPPLPPGWWERAVQTYACVGILHCHELDPESRRQILTDLAFGIEDWITETALFALIVGAWTDPSCRIEVRDAVGLRLLEAIQAAELRPVTILESLATLALITPDMIDDVKAMAHEILDRTEEREAATAAPEPPEEPAAPRPGFFRRLFRRGR